MTWAKRMVEKYGTTADVRRAAFVLPDGTLVKYHGDPELHALMAVKTAPAECPGHNACLLEFLKTTGSVRLHDWRLHGGAKYKRDERDIEVAAGVKLSKPQRLAVRKFAQGEGPVYVDVLAGKGQGFCLIPDTGRARAIDQCLEREGVDLEPGLDGVRPRRRRSRR